MADAEDITEELYCEIVASIFYVYCAFFGLIYCSCSLGSMSFIYLTIHGF